MKGIGIAVAIGVALFALAQIWFPVQHAVLIGLVALLVALWTNEALPLGVVSTLPILLSPSLVSLIPMP